MTTALWIRRIKSLTYDLWRRSWNAKCVSTLGLAFIFCFLWLQLIDKQHMAELSLASADAIEDFELNNFGSNVNVLVNKTRHMDVPESKLKTILMWNDAYGVRTYDIGHGREPFYTYKCPDTRCVATSNRSYLPSEGDFDAVIFHQRSFDFNDLPKVRKPHQRYIHWVVESAQYLYMDINQLNGIFNWTMTYRRDSDFYLPYGRFRQIKAHPTDPVELKRLIKDFGIKNKHLVGQRKENKAAWFVSHCATQARRERYAKMMQKYMDVDIYGKCSRGKNKHECSRDKEWECYKMMEETYKFYLSFENSVCDDYVTEKYFNILKYNVIPVTFTGTNFTAIGAPPHSSISVLGFDSPKKLVEYLDKLNSHDELYAEYFWWKDYYEIRDRAGDRAQPYCDLCARLNNPDEPVKTYDDMFGWWVTGSHCKKLRSSMFGS